MVAKYDESKHRRDQQGRYASKPALGADAQTIADARAAMDVLADAEPAIREIGRGAWEVASATAPPTQASPNTIRLRLTSDPWRAARVAATVDSWERPHDVLDRLNQGCNDNVKVTLLRTSRSRFGEATRVTVEEVTLARGSRGEAGYLPKGRRTNGILVQPDDVLDIRAGWGKTSTSLKADWLNHATTVPAPTELTQADLDALPDADPDRPPPSQVALTVFGTHPGFGSSGEGRTPGCVWFITDYDRENDIANGYMWAPAHNGLASEHGSVYGKQLRSLGGRVPTPPDMRFGDCLDLPEDRAAVWSMLR